MKKIKESQLDRWFKNLDSRDLMYLYPSKFEKIVQDIDYYEEINEFIDECDDDWDSLSYNEKLELYNANKDNLGEI